MSVKKISKSSLTTKVLKASEGITPWIRNPTWLTLPSVTGQQKFVGLCAVFPDSNFLAVYATGAYTVDWGDGVVEDVATSVQRDHEYDFSTVDPSNSTMGAVTFTAATNTVNRVGHGYTDGKAVTFFNIVNTTGILAAANYFVINATNDTFQVSATLGGSVVPLLIDGSATLLNYKQVIVTIVPNGGNLQTLDVSKKYAKTNLQTSFAIGWLDIAIEGSNLNSVFVSTSCYSHYLEQFSLTGTNSISSISSLFLGCRSLQSVPSLNVGSLTNVAYAFQNCTALQSAPNINTAEVTNFTGMFANCASLKNVPLYNTMSGTNFFNMFSNCTSLKYIKAMNTVNGTNFASMFTGCNLLRKIPLLNTENGTNFSSMFNLCAALAELPKLNTGKGTTFNAMFTGCKELRAIPILNTSSGVGNAFSNMFNSCHALTTIPLIDTSNGTDFSSMFANCVSLTSIPLINTSKGTNFASMFAGVYSLNTIPLIDTSKGTNMSGFFYTIATGVNVPEYLPKLDFSSSTNNATLWFYGTGCYKATFIGTKATISYVNAKLSKAALEDIFINLGTGTGQTITVTGNHGATPPIALQATTGQFSLNITMPNTTGVAVGDFITGVNTAITSGITISFSGGYVQFTGHGLANGDMVSFSSITTATGVSVNTIYYVVTAAANNFQVALTPNGEPLIITNGSGTLKYLTKVVSINPNTSITVDRPTIINGATTLSFRPLNLGAALLRGWTVTGG